MPFVSRQTAKAACDAKRCGNCAVGKRRQHGRCFHDAFLTRKIAQGDTKACFLLSKAQRREGVIFIVQPARIGRPTDRRIDKG